MLVTHSRPARKLPMDMTDDDLVLVTGATGLVGSHFAERARQQGWNVRALVRPGTDASLLENWGVDIARGQLDDSASLAAATNGVSVIVHCAAKVGDWGPTEDYRRINVGGVEALLNAATDNGLLKKFIHVSSLGVYEARDHHGTDEHEQPSTRGIDGYTLTKVESELVVRRRIDERGLPGVILRPGFIYGPRDRTVLPRIFERLKTGKFAFLGSPDKLMNNTFVGNLCDAIFLALTNDSAEGQTFNIRDPRLVSKEEFIVTLAERAGYERPTKVVPLPIARALARLLEGLYKILGKTEAPILSNARIKFLGLNLDYSIEKAKRELGYTGNRDFSEAMPETVDWFRDNNLLP